MKKLLRFSLVLVAALSLSLSLFSLQALAATPPPAADPSGIASEHQDDEALGGNRCANASNCELITNYIDPFINFVAALVGVAVLIAIIYGGIEYGSSGGDPQKTAAGKNRIKNAILALLTFFFLYAMLNFLIPGGLQ